MATPNSVALELASEFGEYTSDAEAIAQLEDWIQEVYDHIFRIGRWPFAKTSATLVGVAQGTADYAAPSTIVEIEEIHNESSNARLQYMTIQRVLARGIDPTAEGAPTSWRYHAGSTGSAETWITLTPVPDATAAGQTFKVYGIKRPARLGSTDTIELPNDFINVLKEGVRAKIRFTDGDVEGAAFSTQKYMEDLNIMAARFGVQMQSGSRLKLKTRIRTTRSSSAPAGSI